MEKIVEIYNEIWKFILKVLADANVNVDLSKVPSWLNVPQA